MTTRPVDGWTASSLLFDGHASEVLAARFDDPEVRAALAAQTGLIGRRLIEQMHGQIVDAVGSFTTPSLSEVLVRGWNAHRALRAAAIETCRPEHPTGKETVELDPHEISHTQHPQVDVTLDGEPVVSLRFELAVVVRVEGLGAVVRLGRLVAVESGSCEVKATLTVQGAELARSVRSFAAPLVVTLGGGVPLAVPQPRAGNHF